MARAHMAIRLHHPITIMIFHRHCLSTNSTDPTYRLQMDTPIILATRGEYQDPLDSVLPVRLIQLIMGRCHLLPQVQLRLIRPMNPWEVVESEQEIESSLHLYELLRLHHRLALCLQG